MNKNVLYLRYGRRTFQIGIVELRGLTVRDLMNLDPDNNPDHMVALRICELATQVRLASGGQNQTLKPEISKLINKLSGQTGKTPNYGSAS